MSTTRRKPSSERRPEIAAAALRILGEGGPKALTAASLAEAVGVTSGALFRHFPSVEAILDAVVVLAEERLEPTFPPDDDPPLARLRHMAERRVAALAEEPGLAWLLRSDQAARLLPPDGGARLAALVRRSREALLTALRDAAREGVVRDDVPPDVLLVPFTATVHALGAAGGVQARAVRAPAAKTVLDGLFLLLAPPRG